MTAPNESLANELTGRAIMDREWRQLNPEGLEVLVVTTDPDVARMVAQDLAQALHPDRRIGRILHVDEVQQLHVTGIPVVVQDLGAK